MFAMMYVTSNNPDGLLNNLMSDENFDPQSKSSVDLLKKAFKLKFPDVQDVLMKQGIGDSEYRDKRGNHFIHRLAIKGNLSIETCLQNGIPVDLESNDGETALSLAQLHGNEDVEKYLIKKGANEELAKKIAESRAVQVVFQAEPPPPKRCCNLL